MVIIYKGDDVDFAGKGEISVSILSLVDITGYTGRFEFMGVTKDFSAEMIAQKTFTFTYSAAETDGFCLGQNFGKFTLFDTKGRKAVIAKVLVDVLPATSCSCGCCGANGILIGMANVAGYDGLAGKPKINGITVEGDHDGRHYGLQRLPEYSPEATYTEGEQVIRGGEIWICTVLEKRPGPWDERDWARTGVSVLFYPDAASLPRPGSPDLLYLVTSENKLYRWQTDADDYVDISGVPDIDEEPTQGSENLVTSGGVYAAIQKVGDSAVKHDEFEDLTPIGDEYTDQDMKDLLNGILAKLKKPVASFAFLAAVVGAAFGQSADADLLSVQAERKDRIYNSASIVTNVTAGEALKTAVARTSAIPAAAGIDNPLVMSNELAAIATKTVITTNTIEVLPEPVVVVTTNHYPLAYADDVEKCLADAQSYADGLARDANDYTDAQIAQTFTNLSNQVYEVGTNIAYQIAAATTNIESQLELKANDSDVVHRTGNLQEEITGHKIFQNAVTIGSREEGSVVGSHSFADGKNVVASAPYAHAEGEDAKATGNYAHAEGYKTEASSTYAHAEGEGTTASGKRAHAEGNGTTAAANYSHAEGLNTTTIAVPDTAFTGNYSHAEGERTIAVGEKSHVEGYYSIASGNFSHAEGFRAVTAESGEVVISTSITTNEETGVVSTNKVVTSTIENPHRAAFAWQGQSGNTWRSWYHSHGDGTFNINPVGGVSGFYIGDTNFTDHIANLAATKAEVEDLRESKVARTELFPTWSANTPYKTTSLVIHDNAIYKCKTNHTSGAQWDSTKWGLATGAVVLSTIRNYNALADMPSINGETVIGAKTSNDFGILDQNNYVGYLTDYALASTIAPEFDRTKRYAVGDLCIYLGPDEVAYSVYQCTVAHSGGWNAAHFEKIPVSQSISERPTKSQLSQASQAATNYTDSATNSLAAELRYALVSPTVTPGTGDPVLPADCYPIVMHWGADEYTIADSNGVYLYFDETVSLWMLNDRQLDATIATFDEHTLAYDGIGFEDSITFGGRSPVYRSFPTLDSPKGSVSDVLDRAVNSFSLSGDAALTLPAAKENRSRDFYLNVTATAASSITVTGATLVDATGSSATLVAAAGATNKWHLTEISSGVFLVSGANDAQTTSAQIAAAARAATNYTDSATNSLTSAINDKLPLSGGTINGSVTIVNQGSGEQVTLDGQVFRLGEWTDGIAICTSDGITSSSLIPNGSAFAHLNELSAAATAATNYTDSATNSLATVARTGSYNDLANKPDLTEFATTNWVTDTVAKLTASDIHVTTNIHSDTINQALGRKVPLEADINGINTASHLGVRLGAVGVSSFAQGGDVEASGANSHAQGYLTAASGDGAHAEGSGTKATSVFSHAEGVGHMENDAYVAYTIASGAGSHAEGYATSATNVASHAEGQLTQANGFVSHAEGYQTYANGEFSHAEGGLVVANAMGAHAEGYNTLASGQCAHAEGNTTHATNYFAHSEGLATLAAGRFAHSEGSMTKAEGRVSHSEGNLTVASGTSSHAEGNMVIADGIFSHAEGINFAQIDTNTLTRTELFDASAGGLGTHTEGFATKASGLVSFAGGFLAHATNDASFVWQGYSDVPSIAGLVKLVDGADPTTDQEALAAFLKIQGYSQNRQALSYGSNGQGTFNINPVGGIAGFYIGDTNFVGHIANLSATKSDATLTERGYSAWTFNPSSYWTEEGEVDFLQPIWKSATSSWLIDGATQVYVPGAFDDTTLSFVYGYLSPINVTATRTAIPGYILGTQTNKPIASVEMVTNATAAIAALSPQLADAPSSYNQSHTTNTVALANNACNYITQGSSAPYPEAIVLLFPEASGSAARNFSVCYECTDAGATEMPLPDGVTILAVNGNSSSLRATSGMNIYDFREVRRNVFLLTKQSVAAVPSSL